MLSKKFFELKRMVARALWLSHVQLFSTPSTAARQAPLSTGFSGQEYCSGLPFSSPGDLSHPGIESVSLVLCAGGFFTTEPPGRQKVEMVGRERLAALCQ